MLRETASHFGLHPVVEAVAIMPFFWIVMAVLVAWYIAEGSFGGD